MVAIEKETKLKEYMLMMGLSRNALWASWYLHYFLLLIIPCLLTMVVLTGNLSSYGSVLQMSDSFIVFIFLMPPFHSHQNLVYLRLYVLPGP